MKEPMRERQNSTPLAEGGEWFRRMYRGEGGMMKVVPVPKEVQ
jgi:hypothetical protein